MSAKPLSLKGLDPAQYVVYVGFLLIFAAFAVVLRDDGFLTANNLVNIVQQTAPITIMAIGMVFVLTSGEIDLSIGSVVAIAALVAAVVMRTMPWPVGVAAGLGAGALIGLVNGALVAYVRLPSFLVTLASMGLLAGVGRWLTNLQSVPVTNDVYTSIFGAGALFGIPSLILWTVIGVAVGHFVYRETPFGAHVLATGDNPRAARAAGINVDRLRLGVLVLSSMTAALAGLLYAGRLHGARYTLGETDLLTVIAAVIVGGTRLNGGTGTVVGALIGSLMMGMLNNGLILMGLSVAEQMMVRGLIILAAVALTLREARR
ncbi:ABC transporter permease [Kaistia geumhonensis]|uniref:Ribose transport system permease protein n=1 Tax=Kaistia geumhonensis TaxID=410839 RepID=A0ABU0M713_9HYPH|nr:ABC transporter permease [Kaistia geumhonensis]MCX5478186.1 ABC transporter permease [Kaistia geumhonensis]MDQ0516598.1 ribose transport system permease protein [Kaistia geumhonensis]